MRPFYIDRGAHEVKWAVNDYIQVWFYDNCKIKTRGLQKTSRYLQVGKNKINENFLSGSSATQREGIGIP